MPAAELPATLDRLSTPCLLADENRLDRNIATMARLCADTGVVLRPHVKTSKCWEVARRQLATGAIGFTCSTPAEVLWLQQNGVDDLLWAHQPVGPAKVDVAVAAARRGGLTVALDSIDAARPLSAAADTAGVTVPYLLEVDTGHHRAGVDPDRAHRTATEIARMPGLRLRGVMTHEGHLAALADPADRAAAGRSAGTDLVQVATDLRENGHAVEIISVGSTPGAASAPRVEGVTEARPGTYIYFDANQLALGTCTLDDCALTVLSRITSTQRAGTAIIDAGLKAMSSDAIAARGSLGLACDLAGRPLAEVTFADGNEEHGFLTGPGTRRLRPGDLVRIVPNHACGTTNMWSHLVLTHDPTTALAHPIVARH